MTFLILSNTFIVIDSLITHFAFPLSITIWNIYCCAFIKFLIILRLGWFYLEMTRPVENDLNVKKDHLQLKKRLPNVTSNYTYILALFFEYEADNRSLI